jgi:hypothetical protein
MTAAVIDTLKLVQRLRETMGAKEAEALAEALNESLGERVATKADIEASEARLTNKLYGVTLTLILATGIMQHFLK